MIVLRITASITVGIAAAAVATFSWGLNFVVPFMLHGYSIFDVAIVQAVASAVLAMLYLTTQQRVLASFTPVDYWVAFNLGLLGYAGYYLALEGAAIYAGPVIAPAFLALVPIAMAGTANFLQPVMPWRSLILPLTLGFCGLILVQINFSPRVAEVRPPGLWLGILLAIAAVVLWTTFGLLNQAALNKRPQVHVGVWSALILIGAGIAMMAFLPVGLWLNVFRLPKLGFGWSAASAVYLWGGGVGVFSSVGGAVAWTIASKRLPAVLSGQLIVLEPFFGTVLGLLVHHRRPMLSEAVGMVLLLSGVLVAVNAFGRASHDAPVTLGASP
jgi:drug/metabolite transporter (DMT)-like permease